MDAKKFNKKEGHVEATSTSRITNTRWEPEEHASRKREVHEERSHQGWSRRGENSGWCEQEGKNRGRNNQMRNFKEKDLMT